MGPTTASVGAGDAVVDSSHSRRELARPALLGLLAVIGAVGLARQYVVMKNLTARFVTDDQALNWLMARDWGSFHPRELTFYGQSYGTSLDALPVGLLHRLGLPFGIATAITLGLMTIVSWWGVGWASWRRGWTGAAITAFAAPALLTTEHLVVVGSYVGASLGRTVATCALAMLLVHREQRWMVGLGTALLGSAFVIDSSSALIVGPTMVWLLLDVVARSSRRMLPPFILGTLIPVIYLGTLSWYGGRHPDHELHPEWQFAPGRDTFLRNVRDPDGLFGMQSIGVARDWRVPFLALTVILVIAVVRRRYVAISACLTLVAGLVVLMALPKSFDEFDTIFFDRARLTTSLPIAIWLVGSLAIYGTARSNSASLPGWGRSRGRHSRPSRSDNVARHALVLVIIAALGVLSLVTTRSDIAALRIAALKESRYSVELADGLEHRCANIHQTAVEAQVDVVVVLNGPRLAYGCAAIYPKITTIFPAYERRWWVLDRLADEADTRIMFAEVDAGFCGRLPKSLPLVSCTDTAPGAIVTTDPMSPLDVIHQAGLMIRPFGDDCHPQVPETCKWFAQRFPPL